MKNATIFKAAHKLAKSFEGNYSARFALALRTIYNSPMIGVTVDDVYGYIKDIKNSKKDIENNIVAGSLAYEIYYSRRRLTKKALSILAVELSKSPIFTRIVYNAVTSRMHYLMTGC